MDADHLLRLARDRPLVTREINAWNAFYGHAQILRRYARLSGSRPLKVVIEHGVVLDDLTMEHDLEFPLPVYLCPSLMRKEAFERDAGPGKKAIAIGPPIEYVRRLAGGVPDAPPRRTLLVFPAHSTPDLAVRYDVDWFLRAIEQRAAAFDSVVICMYYKDVLHGTHERYLRRGYECVTAGHHADQRFLFRLLDIIGSGSAVMTNQLGTHIPYAAALGRPVQLVEQPAMFDAPSADLLDRGHLRNDEFWTTRGLRALFADPVDELTAEQRALIDQIAGLEHVKEPGELRAILHDAEELYRRQTRPGRRLLDSARAQAHNAYHLGLHLRKRRGKRPSSNGS